MNVAGFIVIGIVALVVLWCIVVAYSRWGQDGRASRSQDSEDGRINALPQSKGRSA
jgi:hypothetical protein